MDEAEVWVASWDEVGVAEPIAWIFCGTADGEGGVWGWDVEDCDIFDLVGMVMVDVEGGLGCKQEGMCGHMVYIADC